jgi:putative oxygen-independent coproporphyrinogen III oxidase
MSVAETAGSQFAVYLHWPYCAAVCPYCAFNVYRARGADNAPLIQAIAADLAAHRARFGPRRAVSLFLGGGTPSLLTGAEIERLISAARVFEFDADVEITLEANPEDWPRFADHARAGINRFSIGVQSLDDAALKKLGRFHDAQTARAAVEAAAQTGARVSLDLIYAREGQGIAEWTQELNQALALPVEHLSLYQLTIEDGTAFARAARRGRLATPDAELAATFYEATQELCEAAGFPAYEISNHARAPAARAKHNLVYWRSGEWAGIGPGAHGRINEAGARLATEAQRRPADYIDAVRENGLGWLEEARLSPSEAADEIMLMGLRIDEGVDIARLEAARGRPLAPNALAWLQEQQLVLIQSGRLRLAPRGRLIADRIAAELSAAD